MQSDPMAQGVGLPQGVSNQQMGMQQPMPPQVDPTTGQPMQPQQPQKKPSLIPPGLMNMYAQALNGAKKSAAEDLAKRMGPARGMVSTKDTDALKLWRKRDPSVDPLYEKIINKKSDKDILDMMYPARSTLIKVGHRTYTEQVEFAQKMAAMDADPRYADLSAEIDDDEYEVPQAKIPSRGYEPHTQADTETTLDDEELEPMDQGE